MNEIRTESTIVPLRPKRTYHNQPYVVPRLEFFECPDCGERVYDRDAMRKIAAASPGYHKPRRAARR